MKHLILGLGSIGRRHYANLKRLLPAGDELVTVDPDPSAGADSTNIDKGELRDNVLYICSPTKWHASHIGVGIARGARAIFVEKPLYSKGLADEFKTSVPIVCAYNYRFHSEYQRLKQHASEVALMSVVGIENAASKYGNTALETMLSHYLDLGLWLFGKLDEVQIVDCGWYAHCAMNFEGTQFNVYSQIDGDHHRAECQVVFDSGRVEKFDLGRDTDAMYIKEMVAWLNFLEMGERGDLCFYEDALKVQRLMQEAR